MAKPITSSLDLPAMFTKAGYQTPKLTPVESAAISKRISALLSKGNSVEDATSKALHDVVPGRARLLVAEQVRVEDIPGGHYTCVDNGDGTWNILDVPVVGEIRKGEKDAPFDVGPEWHAAALRKALTRQGDGHWGAVHINHHAEGVETTEAGMIRFRRVGMVMYQGTPMSAMYADLLRVPESTYELIDKGHLRYMSVEIASWEEPEVASLAIMPDETPFFRLPMLTTGKKLKADSAVKVTNLGNYPAIAYARAGEGAFVLFNLGGNVKNKKALKAPIDSLSAEEKVKKEELETLTSLKEYVVAKLDGSDGGDDGDGGDFMLKLFRFAKSQLKKKGHKFDGDDGDDGDGGDLSHEGADGAGDGAYGRDQATTGGNSGPGKFGRPPVEQGDENMDTKEVAALSARMDSLAKDNAQLKAENVERDRKEKIKVLVAGAHETLKGFYLSADTKAKLQKLAEKDPSGEILKDFVDTYKTVASPDDLPADESRRMSSAPVADEPEALVKLAAKGPDAVARGREIYREFQHARETNHVPASMTFERYLDINLSLPTLKVRK